ncbi:MFS transporter [Streptomyces sp. ISL-96]|nr:MFS transporter [Streptomyces sp. ISL-96]MBT2489934.1 MFS transporter [Streptomyces sp. ISL-96]
MTALPGGGAPTGTAKRPPRPPRAALPALCATQITGWGVVYYAFPVLLPHLTADTGWSTSAATAAFSVALLVSALAGIPVGRILDRRGPRAVMTTGSLIAVVSILLIAAAPNVYVFIAAWVVAGVGMAATFYQPAFAAVTRWWGSGRVRALTIVTLAGGLASTVFAPLTAVLADHLGWRTTYVVLAVILAAVTIPAHSFALRAPWPAASPPDESAGGPTDGPAEESAEGPTAGRTPVARSRPFLVLTLAFALSGFAMHAVVIGLVPLLIERGAAATTAAWALGLGGAGQTLGRTLYATLARRTGVTTRTTVLIAAGGATTAALALVPGPVPLLILLAVLAGVVRGNLTLLQATAVAERWGTGDYARLSALLAAPATVAGALAPWAGAALAPTLGGYPALFAVLAAASLAAAAAAALGAAAGTRACALTGVPAFLRTAGRWRPRSADRFCDGGRHK